MNTLFFSKKNSVRIQLKQNKINFEFRTTVVNTVHKKEDFLEIANACCEHCEHRKNLGSALQCIKLKYLFKPVSDDKNASSNVK
jgi:hypothetical protein